MGAHIGAVTIPLALDNADLRVLAIEAVPDNADLLRRNVTLNDLDARVTVLERAASRSGLKEVEMNFGYRAWRHHAPADVATHRFIGNQYHDEGEPTDTITVQAISLPQVLAAIGGAEVEFLKIDCEGCEWDFLASTAISYVRELTGELHRGYELQEYDPAWAQDESPGYHRCEDTEGHIRRLLEPTHHVEVRMPQEIFKAMRVSGE